MVCDLAISVIKVGRWATSFSSGNVSKIFSRKQ
jgi:hypothetical protein